MQLSFRGLSLLGASTRFYQATEADKGIESMRSRPKELDHHAINFIGRFVLDPVACVGDVMDPGMWSDGLQIVEELDAERRILVAPNHEGRGVDTRAAR